MKRNVKTKGKGRRKGKPKSGGRKIARTAVLVLLPILLLYAATGTWYIHHPRKWLESAAEQLGFIGRMLSWIGDPIGDTTDALGLTGHDAVYEYDEEAPSGQVLFGGVPRRIKAPAPADITVLDRGEFLIGWSPSLRHAVWVAYHVPREKRYDALQRPSFIRDASLGKISPTSSDYERTGYDRGHLAPNYAIVTRFGEVMQKRTFLMSNIAPQTPSLNRGVWRQIEHRIADFWTARYGEIWVIVGCIPSGYGGEKLNGTNIDVPGRFFQLVVAQEKQDIRALALVYDQSVAYDYWPTHGIVTIDELEDMTGLDFLPELPSFIQDPLEEDLPTRLWPVRLIDVIPQLWMRYRR